jgi:hypothetical protein
MRDFSIWHWIIIVLIVVVPPWIFSRTVAKAGFSPWWAALGLVPVFNLVMLWVFAFAKWPALPER